MLKFREYAKAAAKLKNSFDRFKFVQIFLQNFYIIWRIKMKITKDSNFFD